VRRYRFRALIKFDPAARDGRASGPPGRSRALAAHACCLLQPLYCREYFPAVISPDEDLPPFQSRTRAEVTIALGDGEADTFFAPGQCFAIWADGVVDDTVRAEGLVGHGIIRGLESQPVTCGDGGGLRGTAAGRAGVRRLAAARGPTTGDHRRTAAGLSAGTGRRHDDQEEAFQVAFDQHAEQQAKGVVGRAMTAKAARMASHPASPGRQRASRTTAV